MVSILSGSKTVNVPVDLVKSTEAASIAASRWIGSGRKEHADKAATDAMKAALAKSVDFAGKVVMGEGKKDKSFGIFDGEIVGRQGAIWTDNPSRYKQLYGDKKIVWHDIAVDPIEGNTPTVTSGPEAISAIAVACKDSMFHTDYFYTNKIVYGNKIKRKTELSLSYPLEENLRLASEATRKPISDLMVCVLNRGRHRKIIQKLRSLGVRIKLLQDCDIVGAVAACLPNSNVDFLYGIGGSPETVISTAAISALGGGIEAQVYDQNMTGNPDPLFSNEKENWFAIGDIIPKNLLISGDSVFAATGITNGSMLKGVRYTSTGLITHSVFMKSDEGEVRWIETHHNKVRR